MEGLVRSFLNALDWISYFVDPTGKLVAVGQPAWDNFARENDAEDSLREDKVIGKELAEFISGSDVLDAYRGFVARLKTDPDARIVIPCHCESPTVRREYRLSISAVRFQSRLVGFLFVAVPVSEQGRAALRLFDFQAMNARSALGESQPILKICSYCQRVDHGGDGHPEWIEAAEYYRRGGVEAVRLSHCICDSCQRSIVDPQI